MLVPKRAKNDGAGDEQEETRPTSKAASGTLRGGDGFGVRVWDEAAAAYCR
jgi:hypothetical protein